MTGRNGRNILQIAVLIHLFQLDVVLDEIRFAVRAQLSVEAVRLLLVRRRSLGVLLAELGPADQLLLVIELISLFHADLALRLDATLSGVTIARPVLLKITHLLKLLLGTLICLLRRDVEVGAGCGQAGSLGFAACGLQVSLDDGG